MTVSVLLTVYNSGEFLSQAIGSVLDQSYTDFELLIMDDGSTDPLVWRTLQETADLQDPRVTVERFAPSKNERRATCRYATLINWGAERTSGEYITYLAGDDFYFPQRLSQMIRAIVVPAVHVVYGAQEMIGDTTGIRGASSVLSDAFHRVDLNSVMHTRESFERVGGWDDSPDVWRDADGHFWNRLTDAGYRFHPVVGAPTDCKRYRALSVDQNVINGKDPWA